MKNQLWGLAIHGGVPAPLSGKGCPPQDTQLAALLSPAALLVPSHAAGHPRCDMGQGDDRTFLPLSVPPPSDRRQPLLSVALLSVPRLARGPGNGGITAGGRNPGSACLHAAHDHLASASSGSGSRAGDFAATHRVQGTPRPASPGLGPLSRQVRSRFHCSPGESGRSITCL